MERLLIQNIGLLATPAGHEARRGPAQGEISMTKKRMASCRGRRDRRLRHRRASRLRRGEGA